MKSGHDSGSRFAGMVMVGFVLAAALTLGVALAPAGAGSDPDPSEFQDFDEDGPWTDVSPTPDIDAPGEEPID
jgi:hypothetical protein